MIGRNIYDYNNQFGSPDWLASRFNDPLAHQIEWIPIGNGGSNFCSHRLVRTGQNKMNFRPTIGLIFFCAIFILAGIIVLAAIGFSISQVMPFALGLIFTLVGSLLLFFKTRPYVFDKDVGLYYKGSKLPADTGEDDNAKIVRLGNVHALQLLKKFVSGKNSYYCYEMNFILHSGHRIPVIAHGSRRRLREDANSLSEFMNVPVWDAIQ